jgi:hypothetical protein
MAVRSMLLSHFKVPKGAQRYARGYHCDQDERVINQDDDEKPSYGAADRREGPDAGVEEEDRHLGATEAELIEKDRPPASLNR